MRDRTKNALTLVGGVVVALLLAEGVVRFVAPQPTWKTRLEQSPAMYQTDDRLPFVLRPGFQGRLQREEFDIRIRINADGFRGDELALPADRLRIMALGDSFTFGWGVEAEETYSNQLQQRLAANGRSVEVVNAGFAAGYTPDTYFVFLRNRALAFDPDLLLIGFFIGNDIDRGKVRQLEWVEVDPEGLPTHIVSTTREVRDNRWYRRKIGVRYRTPLLRDSHLVQLASNAFGSKGRGSPSALRIYRDPLPEETRTRVATLKRLFSAMQRIATEAGIPLVVVMIPAVEQIVPDGGTDPEGQDLEQPQRIFAEFFAAQGIRYVDLLPDVREAARAAPLYFTLDEHWNAAGHALAGQRIAEQLELQGVLEP